MRITAVILAAVALLGTTACISGCKSKLTDEDRVWAVICDMADAAEAKDVSRLKDHISKDYSDPAGNDYAALKGMIAYQFLRSGNISIYLRKHEITVKGGRAYATVRAVISRGRKVEDPAKAEPSGMSGFVFDLEFVRDGSDWLLSSAIWRQVGVAEAL